MAQVTETSETEGTWITSGEDHGKPVRYRIRPIPLETERRLYRKVYGSTKGRKQKKRSMAAGLELMEEHTQLRAAFALVDTENFSVELGDDAAATAYGQLIGQQLVKGTEVLLDGKWTDELRRRVLRLARKRAAWISNKADSLREREIEDDEEETEDF
jgi:hypothetical protein